MGEWISEIPYYEAGMTIDNDVAYARSRCVLDVYTPDRKGQYPVILHFHGGGMTSGEKQVTDLSLLTAGDDAVVVTANYRLSCDRAKCPDYLYDAAAAAAWTFRHVAEFGGDPAKVIVTGESAGGYLAAMIGMDPRWLGRFGEDPRKFFLIAPISGQMTTHFQILNERLGTNQPYPERAVIDDLAPLWHAAADLSPIVLYTGGADLDWPARPQENMLLAATLTRIKGHPNASCISLPGFDHAGIGFPAFLLLKKRIAEIGG